MEYSDLDYNYMEYYTVVNQEVYRLVASKANKFSDGEKENIKGTFDDNPLLAFAIGFPEKQEKVMIRYRINKVKIKELTEGLEIEQGDEEGEEDD